MKARTLGLVTVFFASVSLSLAQTTPSPSPSPATSAAEKKQSDAKAATPAAVAPVQATCETNALKPNDLRDDHDGAPETFWIRAAYDLYWIKNGPARQPLVTTGPASATSPGSLSDPNTKILLGDRDFDYGTFNGVSLDAGYWFGDRHIWGVAASGFVLERRSTSDHFQSDSSGNPVLSLPFNDIANIGTAGTTGTVAPQNVYQASIPGALVGSIDVSTTTRFWGTDFSILRSLYSSPNWTFDFLTGFRYLDLEENLQITAQSTSLAGGALFFDPQSSGNPGAPTVLPTGSTVTVADRFHTRNQFYGGEFGAQTEWTYQRFNVSAMAKVALGPNHEVVTISGSTTAVQPNGTSQSLSSGLYAIGRTNTGRFSNDWFAISPEVNLRMGYRVTQGLSAYVGYNFIYLNNVVRPDSQVNASVNTGYVPSNLNYRSFGTPEPSPLTRKDDFWAQGVQFGMEFKY